MKEFQGQPTAGSGNYILGIKTNNKKSTKKMRQKDNLTKLKKNQNSQPRKKCGGVHSLGKRGSTLYTMHAGPDQTLPRLASF
jgi:uncharacterized alpha/beta hydrolase family protein